MRKKCGEVRSGVGRGKGRHISTPTVHGQVGSVAVVTPTPPCKKIFARDGVVTKLGQ